jgi:hypothetical protein
MKIFISWAGEAGNEIGRRIADWLPEVLQSADAFMSARDIDKGAQWCTTLMKELESTDIGIICVTPDRLTSEWLHFEAGALSKKVTESRVLPLLFGVRPSQLIGPLATFQCSTFGREEVNRVVASLNKVSGANQLDPSRLQRAFDRMWPEFETVIADIMHRWEEEWHRPQAVGPVTDDEKEPLLDQILDGVRRIERATTQIREAETSDDILDAAPATSTRRFPPGFLDELRARLSLSDIVGRNVVLKRRSGGEFAGLCPFHNEKTPSFTVNDKKGFFHCFGCGAHGDAVGFLMKTEGLSFPESVEKLARDVGLPLPKSRDSD